mmetsp:Transcript_3729/g.6547  ORF Transcript_3729/g.6547 Transcript_3729/m.6547 type:complete len:275 (+) Transcript_3729:93-917(+)
MPSPGLFADIGKAAKDILTSGYNYDQKLLLNSKASNGVVFKSSHAILSNGPIIGDLAVSSKQGSVGVAVKVDTSSKVTADVSLDNAITKGLKIVVRGTYPEPQVLSISEEYRHELFTATASFDSRKILSGSAVVGLDSLSIGGQVEYDVNKGAATKYDTGIQFTKPDFSISALLRSKSNEIATLYVHNLSSSQAIAAEFVHKRSTNSNLLTLGTVYKLDKTSSLKSKIDTEGVASVSYSQELRPGVTGVLASSFNMKSYDKDAHKIGLSLVVDA